MRRGPRGLGSPLSVRLRPAPAVPQVGQSQDRVAPQHPRAGVAHDHLYAAAQCRLIAVDRAGGAAGLVGPKRAAVQPAESVFEQFLAVRAKRPGGTGRVVRATVEGEHGSQRTFLAGDAG
jgi:hypothetical protein